MVHLFNTWLLLDVDGSLNAEYVPMNFLPLLGNGMRILKNNSKPNLLYCAAKCFGELRPQENVPRMPLDRMPFGLISHNLQFFSSNSAANLQIPEDDKSWAESIYTLFGNKWVALHNGPMWAYDSDQSSAPLSDSTITTGLVSTDSVTSPESSEATLGSNLAQEAASSSTTMSEVPTSDPSILWRSHGIIFLSLLIPIT